MRLPLFRRRGKPLLLRRFCRLIADLRAAARGRLELTLLIAVMAGLAEGAGILMLVPLLRLLNGAEVPFGGLLPAGIDTLPAILLLYVALVVLSAGLLAVRQMVATRLRVTFIRHLRRRLYHAVLRMEWSRFTRLRPETLTHTVVTDVAQCETAVLFLLQQAGLAVRLAVALTVAVSLSPLASALTVGLALLMAPVGFLLNRILYRHGQAVGLRRRALQTMISGDLSSFRLIRIFDLAEAREQAADTHMAGLNRQEEALQRLMALTTVSRQTGAAVAAALTVFLLMTWNGQSLPETLTILVALVRVLMLAGRTTDGWRYVVQALPAHGRVRALLAQATRAAEPPADSTVPAPDGPVTLTAVTTHYTPDRPAVLTGITATLPHRGLTVLTGPSGAGKSTLADLLLGLTEPTGGVIAVGGVPLVGAVRRSWRQRVAMVPQDPVLFHDTIRANLLLAAPQAEDAALWQALRDAGADAFVRALPQGLETPVGDRGTALSGGERQRLALARALVRAPSVLVLDEPTSALDAGAETHVLETLQSLRGRVTVVLISHRPVPPGLADTQIHLDRGQVRVTGGNIPHPTPAGPHV